MIPVLLGQLLGVSFACGLNLYLTVAALGLLSRFDMIRDLPPGLQGLEGWIVIASALALYLVEAVIDKVRHADSLWDAVHTFIRPPAAALLAAGALWGYPLEIAIGGTIFAFFVALAAHGTKAGLRLALNTRTRGGGNAWISLTEDLAAVALAVGSLQYPGPALAVGAGILLLIAVLGPRLWRAFGLGVRCLFAWFRALFSPSRWRELDELPRDLRGLLDSPPLGAAPPRGARAAVNGLRRVGAYRNGWLVVTLDGPVFLYRTIFGNRRVDLPPPREIDIDRGVWADTLHVRGDDGHYTLFMLKDGPAADRTVLELSPATL